MFIHRMQRSTTYSALTLAFVLVLAGCAENILDGNELEAVQKITGGKARHMHLLDQAMVQAAGKSSTQAGHVRLVVGFSDPTVEATKVVSRYKVVRRYKVVSRYEYTSVFPGMDLVVPTDELDSLLADFEQDEEIAWVEPDVAVPASPEGSNRFSISGQHRPWGIDVTRANNSWARSGDERDENGTVDVDIYLLDTGASSSDLNIVECLELSDGSLIPCVSTDDSSGHGTEVIGFAAAKDNKEGIVGVAPGARVHVIKVLNEAGQAESSELIAAIDHLTERKRANPSVPMIVNLSFGADVATTAYIGLDEAVQTSIQAGVVYVVAAGNDGQNAAHYTPAHVKEAITVGAYNRDWSLASFSNWGPFVDILAPGENVEALTTGSELIYTSGTSHAAGWVSGAAALILAKRPSMTPQQVRDLLVTKGETVVRPISHTTNLSISLDKLLEREED